MPARNHPTMAVILYMGLLHPLLRSLSSHPLALTLTTSGTEMIETIMMISFMMVLVKEDANTMTRDTLIIDIQEAGAVRKTIIELTSLKETVVGAPDHTQLTTNKGK